MSVYIWLPVIRQKNVGEKNGGISHFSLPHFLSGQAPANLSPTEGVYRTLLILQSS